MRVRICRVLRASVRRDILVERRLAGGREFREFEAVPAIAAVATSSAASEPVAIRGPNPGEVVRFEGHVRVEQLQVSRTTAPSPALRKPDTGGGHHNDERRSEFNPLHLWARYRLGENVVKRRAATRD